MDESLIDGMIIHGPGSCPVCGGPIWVADTETTIMELNSDGVPISDETVVRCSGICSHCGHKIKMTRWKGGYIPYSRSSLIIKCMQAKDEADDRIKKINSQAKGTNPFAI